MKQMFAVETHLGTMQVYDAAVGVTVVLRRGDRPEMTIPLVRVTDRASSPNIRGIAVDIDDSSCTPSVVRHVIKNETIEGCFARIENSLEQAQQAQIAAVNVKVEQLIQSGVDTSKILAALGALSG